MKKFRLKNNHPTMIKLEKLFNFATELGIGIEFGPGYTIVRDFDQDTNHAHFHLKEIDSNDECSTCPPLFEYKVIYEDPE